MVASACGASKNAIQGLLSPMSQNGTAEVSVGLIVLGILLGIPARARQEARQHLVLEHAALARQRHPGRIDRHHQRLEFRHARGVTGSDLLRSVSWNQ